MLKKDFLNTNNKFSKRLYNTYYKYFFKNDLDSFFGIKMFIKKIIKNILPINFIKNKKSIVLTHFDQVESHKFTIRRGKLS
jgi:hypothetical protein